MPPEHRDDWVWGLAALLMWFGFFALGLFPEFFYHFLREQGQVVTFNAMVNSPFLLYVGLVVYLFAFFSRAARGAGLPPVLSNVLAVQLAITGLVAFLPLRLEELPAYAQIPTRFDRWLILTVCAFKIGSWLYLLSLLCRYYLWSGGDVFRQMVPVFSSGEDDEGGDGAPKGKP